MTDTRSITDVTLWIDSLGRFLTGQTLIALGVALLAFVAYRSKLHEKLGGLLRTALVDNWQLTLLGATGLVLSAASGYTTWDGMSNFTCSRDLQAAGNCTGAHVLSAMVTFGIQGVMLIVAWLIGESFATGMNQRGSRALSTLQVFGAATAAILLMVAIGVWSIGDLSPGRSLASAATADTIFNYALFGAIAALAIALVVSLQNSDLAQPYVQGARVVVKNFVLWIMFLACMATSVFFSFDSLFSAIFPQDERVRAAEIRAQGQVNGIVSDIGVTIDRRRQTATEELFRSEGWQQYDTQLGAIERAARGAQAQIEAYFNDQIEDRNRAIKQQQERIVTSQSGQAGLAGRKISLTDELARLKGERPSLAAEYAEKKVELDNRGKAIDAKRVEAMAEDRGVEGTGKSGKGPAYRERVAELQKLQDAVKIQEDRVKDAQKRLSASDSRIAQIERELAALDGDLSKLKAEAETAEQRIKLAQEALPNDTGARIDPARVLPAFQAARAEFRERPDIDRLGHVQRYCTQLFTAMIGVEVTKRGVQNIDCDPKRATEAAAVVFALNTGADAFKARCAGGDRQFENKTADQLFGFARKCLADSGLPSRETEQLRNRINSIELARDDKAHRFVVTLNAFNDGNKLAYLALAIAIAMDSLVFMSGLFGANALRSPLSDVPSTKARSAKQLEAVIENALLPETYDAAHAVLDAMHPITPVGGFTNEVVIADGEAPGKRTVLKVLNAGATIGAVARDPNRPERYLVRPELFEFLSQVSKKAFETDKRHVNLADLERMLTVAMLPDVAHGADTVLSYMHPIQESPSLLEKLGLKGPHGFMAEIIVSEVAEPDARLVRSALNAGATVLAVQRGDHGHYFLTGDFYRVLARIRGRLMISGSHTAQIAHQGARQGGALASSQDRLAAPETPAPRQIGAPSASPREPTPARPSAREMREQFIGQLLVAMGIDPERYEELAGEAYDAAVDVEASLRHVRDENPDFDAVLARIDHDAEARRAKVYNQLASGLDLEALHILERAHAEVVDITPIAMLSPDGPYDRELRDAKETLEFEAGKGDLPRERLALLKSLQRLVDRLDRGISSLSDR